MMFTTNISVLGLIWSLNIKFQREPITPRAWDRRTLLFLLYNAKFWAKIAKHGYALIGARWDETLSRHVIDFDQWEHAKIRRCTINAENGSFGDSIKKWTVKIKYCLVLSSLYCMVTLRALYIVRTTSYHKTNNTEVLLNRFHWMFTLTRFFSTGFKVRTTFYLA